MPDREDNWFNGLLVAMVAFSVMVATANMLAHW